MSGERGRRRKPTKPSNESSNEQSFRPFTRASKDKASIISVVNGEDEAQELLARLQTAKDKESAKALLEDYPGLVDFVDCLSVHLRERLLRGASADSLLCEAMVKKTEKLEDVLLVEAESTIEGILCRHVADTWLYLETQHIRAATIRGASHSMREGEYWERCVSAAQRRFLAAIETLERVKRIRRGNNIVVNVAEKQVNVL